MSVNFVLHKNSVLIKKKYDVKVFTLGRRFPISQWNTHIVVPDYIFVPVHTAAPA